MRLKQFTGLEVKAIRQKPWNNQSEFWQHFQVTQSGGSRYESGRDIPEPVQLLLNIALGSPKASDKIVEGLRKLKEGVVAATRAGSRGRRSRASGACPCRSHARGEQGRFRRNLQKRSRGWKAAPQKR